MTHMSSTHSEDTLVLHPELVDVLDTALYHRRDLLTRRLVIFVQSSSEQPGRSDCLSPRLSLHHNGSWQSFWAEVLQDERLLDIIVSRLLLDNLVVDNDQLFALFNYHPLKVMQYGRPLLFFLAQKSRN